MFHNGTQGVERMADIEYLLFNKLVNSLHSLMSTGGDKIVINFDCVRFGDQSWPT